MSDPLTIYFGTVTGNAEDLALQTSKRLEELGIPNTVRDLADSSPDELQQQRRIIVIISTWGEGEPPLGTEDIYCALCDGEITDLHQLEYAVLSLGDSHYEDFCACGRKVDAALAAAGAKELLQRMDCDVDYDQPFAAWLDALCQLLTAQHTL